MTDTEKKLNLTRFLREENARNQIRVKNREEILYGSGKPVFSQEDLPLVYDGHLGELEFGADRRNGVRRPSSFGLRVALALLLFGAVVYLDRSGRTIANQKAGELIQNQLTWSAEGKLIDFIGNFPYTLSDKKE